MSHADISLLYEGPAVESGVMDVRDLAPALLAFGNLIEATNRVVNGESATAKVQVRTVGAGSFAVGLDVAVEFLKSVRDILVGPEATAAANLVGVLTGTATIGFGAVALIRKLRGKSPTALRRREGRRIEVEIDGQTIEVDEVVARVSADLTVRAALERAVAEPLASDGIDAVRIGAGERVERIEKPEGYAFRSPIDRASGVYEYRYRAPFSIQSLSFKSGNKWRLNDGRTTLNVTVVDSDFIRRVDASEVAFSKGDILICDVRAESRETTGGLHAEFFIEKVVEQRRPARQTSLFAAEPPESQAKVEDSAQPGSPPLSSNPPKGGTEDPAAP
ncbi:MAG: hypothetical protein ACLPN5_06610 [Roseiarcus sp.]